MTLSNSQVKATARRQGDRLIRVMARDEKHRGFRTMTFSEDEVQAIASIEEELTALVLRSGVEVPVALGYDTLEQKIYRPDFRTDDGEVLDLRSLTGEAARPMLARLKPGAEMPDGTLFAGLMPDSGEGLFVVARQKPLTLAFNEATHYATALEDGGHKDWHLPTQKELNILFNNRAAIGDFEQSAVSGAWYWGSDEQGSQAAQKYFNSGGEGFYDKTQKVSVRYVRS